MKSTLHLFVREYSEGSLPHSFDVRNLSCQNHSSKNRHLQLFGNLSTFPSAFGAHFCPPLGVSVLIRLVIHGKSVVNQWRIPVRFSLMLTWADLLARVTCRWVRNVKETWEDWYFMIWDEGASYFCIFLWVHCYGTILFLLREVLEQCKLETRGLDTLAFESTALGSVSGKSRIDWRGRHCPAGHITRAQKCGPRCRPKHLLLAGIPCLESRVWIYCFLTQWFQSN